jgi:hypothetical protein
VASLYIDIISDIASDILYDILYDISQAGLVQPLDNDAAGIVTGSESILKELDSKHSLNASKTSAQLSDCKPPSIALTSRLLTCTPRGGGEQVLELLVEKVLRELMADMHLAGSHHFAFHEYKDPSPAWHQTFCRALQWFSIFSISLTKNE